MFTSMFTTMLTPMFTTMLTPIFTPMFTTMFTPMFLQGIYVCRPEHTTAKFALARLILRKSGKLLANFCHLALNTM